MIIYIYSNQFNHEVSYLLEEDHKSGRLLVVFGVAPYETDEVVDGRKTLLQLFKITLFHCLKLTSQWFQMNTTEHGV